MERNLVEEQAIQQNLGTFGASNDLRNLDVLRAFAVLAVAGSHLYRYCGFSPRFAVFVDNFGVGGVLFFFVHTALVLLLSLQRTKSKHLMLGFYIRRAFRIYPLCWTCIILVLATGLTDAVPKSIAQMGWHGILVNLLLLQNIIRYPNVEMPLWSLPWEVQMYLLLPAFYLFLKRYDYAIVPLVMWLGATVPAIVFTAFDVPRAFHGAIFPPMFIGGMIAYQFLGRVRANLPSFLWPLLVLGFMTLRCVLLDGVLIDTARNAAVNSTTCLLVGLAIPFFAEVRSHWLRWTAHQLAKYSYGIYLLHIPGLALVFNHFPSLSLPLRIGGFFIVTGIASVTTYHLIENPLIQVGRSIAKRLG